MQLGSGGDCKLTVNDGTKFAIDCAVALKLYCKEHLGCDESGCVFADYDEEGQIVCNIAMMDEHCDVVPPMDWKV